MPMSQGVNLDSSVVVEILEIRQCLKVILTFILLLEKERRLSIDWFPFPLMALYQNSSAG